MSHSDTAYYFDVFQSNCRCSIFDMGFVQFRLSSLASRQFPIFVHYLWTSYIIHLFFSFNTYCKQKKGNNVQLPKYLPLLKCVEQTGQSREYRLMWKSTSEALKGLENLAPGPSGLKSINSHFLPLEKRHTHRGTHTHTPRHLASQFKPCAVTLLDLFTTLLTWRHLKQP